MNKPDTISLSKKLFYSFVISFLIPMAMVNCIVSYLFTARQYREISQQAENNLKLISAYMDNYINDIDNIFKTPYYHSYFQSGPSADTLSAYERNQISKEIEKLLELTTASRDDFITLSVMSDNNVLYYNSADTCSFPIDSQFNTSEWYTAALEHEGNIAIVPSLSREQTSDYLCTESFYISQKLNNTFFPEQTNIIMVNLKTEPLERLFSSIVSEAPLIILFTNENGQLIYSDTGVDTEFINSLTLPKLIFNKKTWNHYSQPLTNYPLTVHVLLSSSYITPHIPAFIAGTFLCYIAGICIAYILFHQNNKWIKQPTYHIKSTLKALESGNLTARCSQLPVQEFNEIGSSVNTMAFQLQEKIKNEYELLISQKELQFQALQSQIQPHFIINTIYSFITLNQIGKQELLDHSFYSFANLLRYVLNKDSNTTIGMELDFLDDYCSLYKLRFGNRLYYEISCAEALRSYGLPKLILQPLVENAVIHGIEPCETSCTLKVNVEEHEQTLYVIIEDNGVGFENKELNSSNSIGIKNVENRISIWNPDAHLYILRINGSTIQILVIPQIQD